MHCPAKQMVGHPPSGDTPMSLSLQQEFGDKNICFGCGTNNPQGLHLASYAEEDSVVAQWTPQPHHQAFAGVLCGGIIGTLLDCHGAWTAAWALMKARSLKHPPATVTAEYSIRLKR